MKKYKIALYISLFLSVSSVVFLFYFYFYRQIPDVIYLKNNKAEEFEFALPVTARVETENMAVETFGSMTEPISELQSVEYEEAETVQDYFWNIRLFGVLPLKSVRLETVEERYVYPVGCPVGIYVKSEGVLVAGLGDVETNSGLSVCPCEHILQSGDYILKIDGRDVCLKGEVIDYVHDSDGEPLVLTISRNDEISQVEVKPVTNKEGQYQIGVWIRDSAQGIGTLTYIDENGNFGALGHGINDIDTAKLLEVDYGGLYETEIVSIKKGNTGEPGEISGVIRFLDSAKIGSVIHNTPNGIYGIADTGQDVVDFSEVISYPAALKQEIEIGPAQIAFMYRGKWELFDIEITDIDYSQSNGNRGLVLRVTDADLIERTGGIIQGMSGSPIIQNGKFIGAVTHVFVNDPTKGYGIFAETMLAQ